MITFVSPGMDLLWTHVKAILQELAFNDVFIVCAAGDRGDRSQAIDTIPPIFSYDIPSLVVSSCDMKGEIVPSSQRRIGEKEIYAPGTDIQCMGGGGRQTMSGSSLCE